MSLLLDILDIFHPRQPAALSHPETRQAAADAASDEELQLTDECIQLIEKDEGDILTAYPDPGSGGEPWTIGYGHTGPDVHPGLTITQAQAEALLEKDLDKFEDDVADAIGDAKTTNNQFSAMVSFAYNVGTGGLQTSSVLRFHNAGQYAQADDAFLLWDKSCGKVMAGLTRRRHQEREMYLGLAIDP